MARHRNSRNVPPRPSCKKLETRPDLFKNVSRPDGGAYFNHNGLLFQPVPELKKTADGLLRAQPFLATLSSDPSLRGVMEGFAFVTRGVRVKAGTFDDFDRPMVQLSAARNQYWRASRRIFPGALC